jgi:hypothetical protein
MRSLVLIIISVLLAGCDYIGGVVRQTKQMPSAPSTQCVREAVSSVEGVTNVTYSLEQGGRPLTLHGIAEPDQVHRVRYTYASVNGDVHFVVRYDGSATYHHTYICINCSPPQSTVDSVYPGMRAIDEAIRSRCGVSAPIYESCRGVRCGGA